MPLAVGNIFQSAAASTDQEHVETLFQIDALRIVRIMSHGQQSPEGFWYDQTQPEWVVLLKGTATLSLADKEKVELKAGNYVLIPARLKHRVECTSEDAVWLAVHIDAQ